MSATQEITEPVGVRPFADGDLQAGLTASANGRTLPTNGALAAANAERLVAGVGPTDTDPAPVTAVPHGKSRSVQDHEAEMHDLLLLQWGTRAPVLERLIRQGRELKQEAFDLGQAHSRAENAKRDASEDSLDAAFAAELEAEKAWEEARGRLDDLALEVLDAPFDDLRDVLTRTDAFVLLVGPASRKAGGAWEPASDEDVGCAYQALRRAISEIIEAHPDNEAFGEAEIAYERADEKLSHLHNELVTKGAVFDPGLQEELSATHRKAIDDRDAAADAILSQRPASLPQLVLQMQIVINELCAHETGSHAARERWLGSIAPTVEEMRTGEPGHAARAFSLILENAARLAQQDLSRGWRKLMADEGGVVKLHPNARDVLALAASKHLDPARFSGIYLSGLNEGRLPQITFGTDEGNALALPGVIYDWNPVK